MRFGAYVIFMLGIAIAFLLLGKSNALFYVLGVPGGYGPTPESQTIVNGAPIDTPGFGGVPANYKDIGSRFITVLTNSNAIAILLGATLLAAGASVVTAGGSNGITTNLTSFAALYFVPILMFFFFANMLLIPVDQYLQQANCPASFAGQQTDAIQDQQCQSAQVPGFVYYPLLAIYNISGVLAVISFFKGGI